MKIFPIIKDTPRNHHESSLLKQVLRQIQSHSEQKQLFSNHRKSRSFDWFNHFLLRIQRSSNRQERISILAVISNNPADSFIFRLNDNFIICLDTNNQNIFLNVNYFYCFICQIFRMYLLKYSCKIWISDEMETRFIRQLPDKFNWNVLED